MEDGIIERRRDRKDGRECDGQLVDPELKGQLNLFCAERYESEIQANKDITSINQHAILEQRLGLHRYDSPL